MLPQLLLELERAHGEGGERGGQTDNPRPVNPPKDLGSMSARGGHTQGVASASSGVAGASDARAKGFNDLGAVALPRIGKKEGFHYSELYPHCGCDPAKDRVAMLDTPYAMLE